jgi:predicted TIM-barrel fold metal-dependent hydrolase
LWDRDLGADIAKPAFISDLKALAEAGLEMDTANPTPALLLDVVRLTDRIPNLRLVIDHLPQLEPPTDAPARRSYEGTLRKLGQRPQIYLKISEVLRRVDGRVPLDLKFYKPRLDELWDIFGEDRLIYGSDWPNSDLWGPYPQMLTVVREYFMSKGAAAAEKYFWKNSVAAYRWVKREPNQPQP